jgi:hypothetical protein
MLTGVAVRRRTESVVATSSPVIKVAATTKSAIVFQLDSAEGASAGLFWDVRLLLEFS